MKTLQRRIRVGPGLAVSSVWRIPETNDASGRVVIIAHGAGGDMRSRFIAYLHDQLARSGCLAVKFNFPYAEEGRKAPDRTPLLEQTWRAVLGRVRSDPRCGGVPVYLAGKSLGGRIASHVAGDVAAAGLIFFGFPLHPPGRRETLRAAHLFALTAPMLFIQGTRDPLCDLALLKTVLVRLKAQYRLHLVEQGDHSFKVPKRVRRSEASVWEEMVTMANDWMAQREAHGY